MKIIDPSTKKAQRMGPAPAVSPSEPNRVGRIRKPHKPPAVKIVKVHNGPPRCAKGEKLGVPLTAGMIRERELVYREACAYLDVDAYELRELVFGTNRHYLTVAVRECMAVILCFRCNYSQPEAARIMGRGAHTTIGYALRRFYSRPYGGDEGLRILGIDPANIVIQTAEVAA